MKGIDIFCASQAATAICLSMEQPSSSFSSLISPSSPSSSSNTLLLGGEECGGGRAIDRHNPIIRDSRRLAKSLPPCTNTSQPPLSPKPAHKNQPRKKKHHKRNSSKENGDPTKKNENISVNEVIEKAHVEVEKVKKDSEVEVITVHNYEMKAAKASSVVRKGWSCTRPGDFISPPGSTRYLLGEKVSGNGVLDIEPALKIFPEETDSKLSKPVLKTKDEDSDAKQASSDSSLVPDQVVVLRVSLHCRGCERKMRKHISRMEGVKSFDIDFLAKKVTVTGKVTPLSVLSSISKVKNAQLWSPAISSSGNIPSAAGSLINGSFIQNEYKGAGA